MVFKDGNLSYISPSYSIVLGYSHEEMLTYKPQDIFESVHPDDVK